MSVLVSWNGSQYLIPTSGESGWATPVTGILQDLGANAVSLTGSQTLSNKTLQLAVGSVGSPSLTFVGDTDTGIFHPNVNQVAIVTNGVQQLLVDASGNLTLAGGMASSPAAGDNSTKIATTAFVQSALGVNVGRNVLHNAMFRIVQRGAGAFTASGYTLDRWLATITLDTVSITQAALADADRTAIGDEEAQYALQNVFTGNAGSTAMNNIVQRVENVRRLSNKTVTVSFWAKAASGTPKLGLNIAQNFGTGGSPSSAVNVLATGNTVTLSTSWTRYSSTIALPSIAGKTLGTNNDHYTAFQIWFSSGSGNNALAGNIGVQTATIQVWGVQLEVSPTATPFEKIDVADDLARCQRFFQYHTSVLCAGSPAAAAAPIYTDFSFPTPMRSVPSVTFDTISYQNASSLTVNAAQNSHVRLVVTGTATGTEAYGQGNLSAAADL